MPGQRQHLAVARVARPRSRRSGPRAPRPRRAGSSGRSSCAPRCRGLALTLASTRLPANSDAAGRAGRGARRTRARGRSGRPAAPVGHAARRELGRAAPAARGRSCPAISEASGPRSDTRSGPLASGVPSRASIVAARRQRRLAPQLLAAPQAGVDELGAPVDARAGVLALAGRERPGCRCSVPKMRVSSDDRDRRRRRSTRPGADLLERERLRRLLVGALEALPASCAAWRRR